MKRFYKYLAFVGLIFFGFLLNVNASNCLDDIKNRGYIKVSTNAEFEPFEYKDGNKMVGIDIDIARKIAEKLGVSLSINDVSFDAVILELLNKNCDFAISAMSSSEEKSKSVDFSNSYYVSKQMVIVRQNSEIVKPEDLHGKKIGVAQNDVVWVESRRGKVKARVDFRGRNKPPVGLVYVPWFDENVYINKVCLDATCPLSKQTDFKKCAVKVYKA